MSKDSKKVLGPPPGLHPIVWLDVQQAFEQGRRARLVVDATSISRAGCTYHPFVSVDIESLEQFENGYRIIGSAVADNAKDQSSVPVVAEFNLDPLCGQLTTAEPQRLFEPSR